MLMDDDNSYADWELRENYYWDMIDGIGLDFLA